MVSEGFSNSHVRKEERNVAWTSARDNHFYEEIDDNDNNDDYQRNVDINNNHNSKENYNDNNRNRGNLSYEYYEYGSILGSNTNDSSDSGNCMQF